MQLVPLFVQHKGQAAAHTFQAEVDPRHQQFPYAVDLGLAVHQHIEVAAEAVL